jgi:hypothetical protein
MKLGPYITSAELVLLTAALVGLLAHFLVKRFRGEITASLFRYLVEQPGFTVATIISIVAACLGIVATGQLENLAPHLTVALGFGTGWTLDSAIAPRVDPAAPPGHAP